MIKRTLKLTRPHHFSADTLATACKWQGKRMTVAPEEGQTKKVCREKLQPSGPFAFRRRPVGIRTPDYGPGLTNQGAMCFMNSALQTLARHLKTTPLPEHFKQQGASELDNNFYRDFLALMEILTTPEKNLEDSEPLQMQFLDSYRKLGLAKNSAITKRIFAFCPNDGSKNFAGIQQEDPQEFLNDVLDLLGLNTHPELALIQSSYLTLKDGGKTLLQTKTNKLDTSATLQLEVPQINRLSLQKIIDSYLSPESLEKYHWDEDTLKENNIPPKREVIPAHQTLCGQEVTKIHACENWTTKKKIVLIGLNGALPASLFLQVKLFSYGHIGCNKLTDDGVVLVRHLGEEVVIPVYPHTEFDDSSREKEPVQQHYRVKSVICHSGPTIYCGHYVTIFREGNKLVCCDDSHVSEVGELNEHGQLKTEKSLPFLNMLNGSSPFGGYVFSLQAERSAHS